GVGEVAGDRHRPSAVRLDPLGQQPQLLLAACHERHPGAVGGEHRRQDGADAAAGAGQEGGPALEQGGCEAAGHAVFSAFSGRSAVAAAVLVTGIRSAGGRTRAGSPPASTSSTVPVTEGLSAAKTTASATSFSSHQRRSGTWRRRSAM